MSSTAPTKTTAPSAPLQPRWSNPAALVYRRVESWWHARLPRSDTLLLTQRNVYILPSRPGLMFMLTLLVLLLASINYQLNLGYLLTFLLAGAGVVGMYLTHSNLRGLTLKLKAPQPVFAGAHPRRPGSLPAARRRPRTRAAEP